MSCLQYTIGVLSSKEMQRQDERCKEFWGSYASKQEVPVQSAGTNQPAGHDNDLEGEQ